MPVKCVVFNPPGNGGLSAPRVGKMPPGTLVEANLPKDLFDGLRRSSLVVAKDPSDEADAAREAAAAEKVRREKNASARKAAAEAAVAAPAKQRKTRPAGKE